MAAFEGTYPSHIAEKVAENKNSKFHTFLQWVGTVTTIEIIESIEYWSLSMWLFLRVHTFDSELALWLGSPDDDGVAGLILQLGVRDGHEVLGSLDAEGDPLVVNVFAILLPHGLLVGTVDLALQRDGLLLDNLGVLQRHNVLNGDFYNINIYIPI